MVHSSTDNALSSQLLAHALGAICAVEASDGLNLKMPHLNHTLPFLRQLKFSGGPNR